MENSARISDCGRYRYYLARGIRVTPGGVVCSLSAFFIAMLNPSTADALRDDATIRRVKGFANRENCAGSLVVNIYAFRATNPADLWLADDPVGPENDRCLRVFMEQRRAVVCGWGANAKPDRVRQFVELARATDCQLLCLGTTKKGAPRHPLYVRGDAPLVPWKPNI